MIKLRNLIFIACAIALAALLQACAMTNSTSLNEFGDDTCHSDAGSYYLSKSLIRLTVDTSKGAGNFVPDVKIIATADRARGYCLDFLASMTAEEALFIQKDKNNLLMKITSDSRDQSVQIIKNFIQAVFVGISGNADYSTGIRAAKLNRPLEFEYDPFNAAEAAMVNDALNDEDVGFCLILEGVGVDPRYGDDYRAYCDDPLRYISREQAINEAALAKSAGGFVPYNRGVLYRPRVPYNFYAFRKELSEWVLHATENVMLENRSPVVALGIERALFTDRKTKVEFLHGVLTDIKVEKGSEVAALSQIPLEIAENIAALPANLVKVQIDITNKRKDLIIAQDKLLKAQTIYNADLEKLKPVRGGPTGVPNPDRNDDETESPRQASENQTPFPNNGQASADVLELGMQMCRRTECGGASGPRCDAYCQCFTICKLEDTDNSCRANCSGNLN